MTTRKNNAQSLPTVIKLTDGFSAATAAAQTVGKTEATTCD
ncbi:MAG: hypothetical protein RQ879_06785 [Sulfolobales archaeon]|nr:hypothetical protein [Sulfolobales archaeon]